MAASNGMADQSSTVADLVLSWAHREKYDTDNTFFLIYIFYIYRIELTLLLSGHRGKAETFPYRYIYIKIML